MIVVKILGCIFLCIAVYTCLNYFENRWATGYRIKWNGVVYQEKKRNGEIIAIKLKQANAKSFIVFKANRAYAKDNFRVYYKGKPLIQSNPNTFLIDPLFDIPELFSDGNYIYFQERILSRSAQHFKRLGRDYFKDQEAVFLKDVPLDQGYLKQSHFLKLPEIDARSFEHVTGIDYLGTDKNHVYFEGKIVKGANPQAIKKLDGFWTDGRHVYFNADQLEHAEVATFQTLAHPFARDKHRIYYEHLNLPKANPSTFKLIQTASFSYSMDSNHVYFKHKIIPKANPLTFVPITNGPSHWKDNDHVYYNGQILEGADPDTFEILLGSNGRYSHYFGKDKMSVFYMNKKLIGADPNSFINDGVNSQGFDQWTDGHLKFDHAGKLKEK